MSGFLSDYSRMQPDPEEDYALVYLNPEWKRDLYDKILLEPIALEFSESADSDRINENDTDRLKKSFEEILVDVLDQDFLFVQEPGTGTIRLRVAITDAKPLAAFVNFLSTLAIKMPLDMGGTSIEAELTDSLSEERLFALVDRREGARMKILGKERDLHRWGHANEAFRHWAKRLHSYLTGQEIEKQEEGDRQKEAVAGRANERRF